MKSAELGMLHISHLIAKRCCLLGRITHIRDRMIFEGLIVVQWGPIAMVCDEAYEEIDKLSGLG
jgi:hypothetical protein